MAPVMRDVGGKVHAIARRSPQVEWKSAVLASVL